MSDLPPPSTPASSRTVDEEHPWLGLAAFTEPTQRFFFGRDEEISDLFVRVREQPLTILYGQSGLGKSSLLGAGLVPKLRLEGYRPLTVRLRHGSGEPSLTLQVIGAMRAAGILGETPPEGFSLWELLHHTPSRPEELADAPPVLLFDQFEEIFTLGQRADRAAHVEDLFHQLADLVENRVPAGLQERLRGNRGLAREFDLGASPVRVVITLREDFLSHLEHWKKRMPSLMRNRMSLYLLNGPQALEAVVNPGRLGGRRLVDEATAADIVRFVAKAPPATPLEAITAVPPLLSLVCDELNHRRLRDGLDAITPDLVEAQSADILQTFYTGSFDEHPAAVRNFVEDRMVTVGGHRSPVARDDAEAALRSAGVADPAAAIDALISRRLISAEDRSGLPWLELTHDVLAPLVVRSRDERRERERVLEAEAAAQAARRARRRLRRLAASFGVLSLLALAGAAYGWRKADAALAAAEEARVANLKAAAHLEEASGKSYGRALDAFQKPDGWRDGFAYLAEALRYNPDHRLARLEASARLRYTPIPAPLILRTGGNQGYLMSGRFSPDGSRLLTLHRGSSEAGGAIGGGAAWSSARLWNASTGVLIQEYLSEGELFSILKFSRDGGKILIVSTPDSDDGTAEGWTLHVLDGLTGVPMAKFVTGTGKDARAAFSPDGSSLAVGVGPVISFWDPYSGRRLGEVVLPEGIATYLEFSPDGGRLLGIVEVPGGGKADEMAVACLWDAVSHTLIGQTTREDGTIYRAAFSPKGRRILIQYTKGEEDRRFGQVTRSRNARLWDATDAKPLGDALSAGNYLLSAGFNGDGSRIFLLDWEGIDILQVDAGGSPLPPVRVKSAVTSALFSPDGCKLLTLNEARRRDGTTNDGEARVWDASSGEPLGPAIRQKGSIVEAAFSPDGLRVLTVSREGTARMWDARSALPLGEELSGVDGNDSFNRRFSPDGSKVLLVTRDGHPQLWNGTMYTLQGDVIRHAVFQGDSSRSMDAEVTTPFQFNPDVGSPGTELEFAL